jgi:hypothetical protein
MELDARAEFDAAEGRAAVLLKRATRYRALAAAALEHETKSRLRRLAADIEAEAAIEMAHAALLRHAHPDSITELEKDIAAAGEDKTG